MSTPKKVYELMTQGRQLVECLKRDIAELKRRKDLAEELLAEVQSINAWSASAFFESEEEIQHDEDRLSNWMARVKKIKQIQSIQYECDAQGESVRTIERKSSTERTEVESEPVPKKKRSPAKAKEKTIIGSIHR
jgi:uncharacterized sporulation protein YeaH/YhbH (DUF444 family)